MDTIRDSFYTIGSTHQVCQDYAYCDENTEKVALSDGCSGAPNSDIGARLMVHSYAKSLKFNKKKILKDSLSTTKLLGIHEDCLCASLIALEKDKTDLIARFYGDGVIVAKHRDSDTFLVYEIEFPTNAPYYIYYDHSDTFSSWETHFGSKMVVTESFYDLEHSMLTSQLINTYPRLERQNPEHSELRFKRQDFEMVIGFSDGISTFSVEGEKNLLPLNEVLQHFLNFKTMYPGFLKRRCKRALKDLGSKNISHYDDLSAVALYDTFPEDFWDGTDDDQDIIWEDVPEDPKE
jgi:hypothetical protein